MLALRQRGISTRSKSNTTKKPICKDPLQLPVSLKLCRTRFPVERWLDKKEGDKRSSLDLEPNKKPPGDEINPNKSIQNCTNLSSKSLISAHFLVGTDYEVTVQTGSAMSAGTDSKVFISFNGDKNKIAKHALVKPESGKNPFEKKSKDVFKFNETDVGKVRHGFFGHSRLTTRHRYSCKRSTSNMMELASAQAGTWIMSKSN